jgi:hypothetical protein
LVWPDSPLSSSLYRWKTLASNHTPSRSLIENLP